MASALETRGHAKIRRWVEERGGRPARVKGTGGLLRIDFGKPDENLEHISWEEFTKIFGESNLSFLYDPERESRFNKFVRDDSKEARE